MQSGAAEKKILFSGFFVNMAPLNNDSTKFTPPPPRAPFQKRWSSAPALKKLLRGPCRIASYGLSLVPRHSLLIRCPREVWEIVGEYPSVTSQLTVESRNDRPENAWDSLDHVFRASCTEHMEETCGLTDARVLLVNWVRA